MDEQFLLWAPILIVGSNANTLEGLRSPTSRLHWREKLFISSLSEKQVCVNKTGGEMRMGAAGTHFAERQETGMGQTSPAACGHRGQPFRDALQLLLGDLSGPCDTNSGSLKHMLLRWKRVL